MSFGRYQALQCLDIVKSRKKVINGSILISYCDVEIINFALAKSKLRQALGPKAKIRKVE